MPPPRTSPWRDAVERLTREVTALHVREPSRAALLLAAEARLSIDALGDPLRATQALTRASELAPDARFVASTWRWLAERGGDSAAILARTRADLEHVSDARERTALLWRIAAIEEHGTSDLVAAQRTLGELLALDPNDIGAWDATMALHLHTKSDEADGWDDAKPSDPVVFTGIVEALETLARFTTDAVTRSALHGAAGALRDRYLDDTEGARTSLHRALEADDANVAAHAALESLLLRSRAWDEYALVIAAQADRSRDPRTAAALYERAGDVYTERVRDHARAAHCFVRAATTNEAAPGPIEKLATVLDAAGRFVDAAAAYERLFVRVHDPAQKAWTLVRLGGLLETRLDRPDDALAAYRLALEAVPTFSPAVHALLRLARARGLTAIVVEVERREADRIADPLARSVRYAVLAELVESEGPNGRDEATALYERAIRLDATNTTAFDALDRIYRAGSQWPRLIVLYEQALASTGDQSRASALRVELAELAHSRMNDPVRAAGLLRDALATGASGDRFGTLVSLARALADAEQWPEYVEILEAQAAMLSGDDEIAAMHRIGSALELRVKDSTRALAMYELVIERAPRHETAARAILRIHSQEARYERVIDAERRMIDLATRTDDVIEGLLRIGRIAEEQLGRVDTAIGAYEEALTRAPEYAPAMAALERLLRGTGEYRRLAEALRTFADATTDRPAKLQAMVRAATLLELWMDDTDSASAVYGRALDVVGPPGGPYDAERHAVLWGLVRLQETRGEWESVDRTLLDLLDTTTEPSARLRVLARLARNAELRLGDLARAGSLYDELMETGAKPATVATDRLRVARLSGNDDAITTHLAGMAACTTDERLATGLRRVLSLMTEQRSPEDAAALYERLVASDPTDPQALDGLVRATRLPHAIMARARVSVDASQKALLALSAGALEEAAGRTDEAEAAFAFALAAEPDFSPALEAAGRLRAQAGDYGAAASLAERTAKVFRDRENAANAWLDAARIHEDREGDDTQALACLRSLLTAQPEHAAGFEHAMRLLEDRADWVTAASVLLAHSEAVTEPSTRARCYARRGTILASRMADTPGAIEDFRRALALRPDEEDVTTMEVLAALEERTKNWPEALQIHGRVAKSAALESVRQRARIAEARIVADELKDYPRARKILEELALERPDDRDVLQRLAQVVTRTGDDGRALELYTQLAAIGGPSERARAIIALSDLKRASPDVALSVDADVTLSRAFDLAIVDAGVLAILEEHATKAGDLRPFVHHAESAIGRVPPMTPGILAMRTTLARVMREKLGNPIAADRHLSSAINAFPDSMPTRLALAAGLRGRNDEAAITELRRAVEVDPTAPEPFAALVTLAIATGRPEVGFMLASTASLLGGTGVELQISLNDASPLRPLPDSLLFEEAMGRLVGPSRAWFLRSILAVLDPFLSKIFPVESSVLDPSARVPDSYPVVAEIRAVATALGVPTPGVYRGGARDTALLLTEPRAMVIGTDYLVETGRPAAIFHAAYACARVAGNGSIYVAPRTHALALLDAAAKPDADGPLVRDFRKRISSALPRKNKKDLERVVLAAGAADLHAELAIWEAEETRRALLAAVVFARDLRAIAQVLAPDAAGASDDDRRRGIAAHPRLCEVLDFTASSACWDAFRRVYGRS